MNVLFMFVSFNGIDQNRGMYGDLVVEFARRGGNIYVIAPSKTGEDYVEAAGCISIMWVRTMPQFNVGLVRKAIANLLLPYQFSSAMKHFLPQSVDLIVTPTPPITFCNLIESVKKKYNSKFFLILRDIFPQNSVDLGMIKKDSLIHKYFRSKERKLYATADKIGCMSIGNIDYILQHNPTIENSKLVIMPNWLENTDRKKRYDGIGLRKKYGIEGKCIAIFGGNLGIAQQPENILELAKLHQDKSELIFIIIGKGTAKKMLKERISAEHINNVLLMDHLPREEYEAIASISQIGLVSLNEKFTIPNIPSRTLGYWEAKLPVFAIIDKNTDYGVNLIDRHNGGVWCIVGDKQSYVDKFNFLYNTPVLMRQMGENGKRAIDEYYNARISADIILNNLYI